jgi:hypothetical protein
MNTLPEKSFGCWQTRQNQSQINSPTFTRTHAWEARIARKSARAFAPGPDASGSV